MIAAIEGNTVGKVRLQLGSKNRCSYQRNPKVLPCLMTKRQLYMERLLGYPKAETSRKQADEN